MHVYTLQVPWLSFNLSKRSVSILLWESCPGNLSSKFDEFLAARSQFDSVLRVNLYAPTCCKSATFVPPLLRLSFVFYDKKSKIISPHFATFTLQFSHYSRVNNEGSVTNLVHTSFYGLLWYLRVF